MRLGHVACLVSGVLAAGCATPPARSAWTEITLRDPRQVAVMVESPGGPLEVLPLGAPPGAVYLPDSVPPFTEAACLGARVTRGPNGATALRRGTCALPDETPDSFRGALMVDAAGRAVLFSPHPPPRWDGDVLTWSVTMWRSWHVPSGRSSRAASEALVTVQLRTPRANVITVADGR